MRALVLVLAAHARADNELLARELASVFAPLSSISRDVVREQERAVSGVGDPGALFWTTGV